MVMAEFPVSVIVITHNRHNSLRETVVSILGQNFREFELIIVDDASEDGTENIPEDFKDIRIKYFRNEQNLGIAGSRNRGVAIAGGKFIFFTDDDCSPYQNWLEEGFKILQQDKNIVAVQGFVVAEKFDRSRVFRRVKSNNWSDNLGNFMCANMAFPKEALTRLGGFDLNFNNAYEDVDIGLRARRIGRVVFSKDMAVEHRRLAYNRTSIFKEAKRAKEQVKILKIHPLDYDYHRLYSSVWKIGPLKIVYPAQLFYFFVFPLYIIVKFIWGRYYRSLSALKLFPMLCIYIIIQRFFVWQAGFKEKILVI